MCNCTFPIQKCTKELYANIVFKRSNYCIMRKFRFIWTISLSLNNSSYFKLKKLLNHKPLI